MSLLLWTVAALAAGLLITVIVLRRTVAGRPPLRLPAGETLPSTPLQRMAGWSLSAGLLVALAAAAVVLLAGPDAFDRDDRVRLTVTGLLVAAVGVLGFFAIRVRGWVAREDAVLDERDRAIFGRAPQAQAAAMLVTLAVWVVALQETFTGTRLVPVVYLHLVFWSCLVVSLLALPVGVLLGYRRD